MSLISNIETNSPSSWKQTPTNDTNASQWLQNAAKVQASNLTSSNAQQTNQSITDPQLDNPNSSPIIRDWSEEILDEINSTNTNQNSPAQLDSPTQSNDYSSSINDPLFKASIKELEKFNINFTNVELYSENWGNVPINQNSPWEIPQSQQSNYQATPREVHSCNGLIDNSWKYSSSTTGTDIWEANIRKKNTDQSSNNDAKNAQNWNSNANAVQLINPMNHHGGVWGEEDTATQSNTNNNNNNNWMNDKQQWNKQWNEQDDKQSVTMNKGMSDSLFSTWNSNANSTKDVAWNETDSNAGMMNDNLAGGDDLGTGMWRRQNNNPNARWKEPNDLLFNKMTMNNNINLNMTNQQCANNNAPMQNGFSTASPGVLRLPSANSINNQTKADQWNKVQTMQPNNPINKQWLDQPNNWTDNQKNLNNLSNGQPNGMFWNNADQTNAQQLNWNRANNMNNNNGDDWNSKLKKEREAIMFSHQFKVLYDKGFKKESIETALRNSNMNIKDAIDELRADVLKENFNDLDKRKNSGFNHPSSLPPNSSISNRNTSQFNNQMSQQPNQMFRNNNNNLNLNNNTKAPNAANAMLQDKRLGNLVQQIQLAVQTGHLNGQILNQPLGVNTIQLIHQLLQQIKNLQTLQSTPNMNKNIGSASQSDLNVQITMIKQRISNLQNQIKLQQAVFINQQQPQTNQTVPNSDLNLNSLDSITNLNNGLSINANTSTMSDFSKLISSPDSPNDFRDTLQSNSSQQSRLSTWKNSPSTNDGFSRAPGSIKSAGPTSSNWSTGGFGSEAWLNDANSNDQITNALSNMNVQPSQTTFSISDSVPEFEPGKPWKGSLMKSSDDDPHLTPGSVNRSILSLNNFNNWPTKNNLQPAATTASSLANTWTFNDCPFNNNSATSPNWNGLTPNDQPSASPENLWQNNKGIKGPPPGLSPNKDMKMKNNITPYVLIKNLTRKIDAPTLRTLCLQHGPLQMFNILNNGVAIVKYKSKEEAIKAQSALNNCHLANTTILVDLIGESEVQNYLSTQSSNGLNAWNHAANTASNSAYRAQQMINSNNPWRNQMTNESQWTFNSSNLWNNSIDAPAMPINNLLPGDLLNGESA